MKDVRLSNAYGSLIVILVIVAPCFPHVIDSSISSNRQSARIDTLLSNSSQSTSNNDDSGFAVDLKGGLPHENSDRKRDDFHHPPADVVFGRKKKPHVLKTSPPINHPHQYPETGQAVLPAVFSDIPIPSSTPCFHHHVKIEPVEIPVSIVPLPSLSTRHHLHPKIEPAEIPASVRPVPSFFESSRPHLPPRTEPAEIPASVRPVTSSFESSRPHLTPKIEPTNVPSAEPSSPAHDNSGTSSQSSETFPNDFNAGDVFASTVTEPHLPTSDNAVTAIQETLKTQVPIVHAEEKPHTDHKPQEPKPHRSIIASILHKKGHLKEVIQHKKKEKHPNTEQQHSIVSSILHKTEHLKEKIHHKKQEGNLVAAEPHRSIISSILHKKEKTEGMIHHEQKNEDSNIASHVHKENEAKEEKIPTAEVANNEGHNNVDSHHGSFLPHKKVHGSVVSSLLHKIKHKRDVNDDHDKKEEGKLAVEPHDSVISSILHKAEHLKEKIHHKKEEGSPAAIEPRHSIISSILHKKAHLKEVAHHEHEKETLISSIFHKKDEAKEVKVPEKESSSGSEVHHELPPLLHKKQHGTVVSSLLHKIHHKRESSSVHKEEESLNFDVPHIGLPVPKPSILHKLKSRKEHKQEHKPHSLLKELLHKV